MLRTALLAGILAALVAASAAGGAPISQAAPAIKGYPGYNSKLTCDPGSWSPDAKSFEYAWAYNGGGPQVATTKTYTPDATKVGYDIVCSVTAKDEAGGATTATSAPVRIAQGRTTIKLRAKKVQHKKVTLTGKVGPRAAVKGAQVVAYRIERGTAFQLFGKTTLKPNGDFKIVAPDKPGRNKYKVNFNPAEPSLWLFASDTVKVNLKRR